jgi:hypothetical protein
MSFQFTAKDFKTIEKVLDGEFRQVEQCRRMVIENKVEKRKLSLEIYSDIPIGKRQGNLVSVYTASTHMQLHFCSGYVVSDMLGEVTFIAECGDKLSGLIIEKGAGCSLYANVDSDILSGDFTQLGPEVMLSGIALSLVETALPEKS